MTMLETATTVTSLPKRGDTVVDSHDVGCTLNQTNDVMAQKTAVDTQKRLDQYFARPAAPATVTPISFIAFIWNTSCKNRSTMLDFLLKRHA
mmetsp:Transcript_27319/g.40333  ORF Transcript_27319/g.40333 Transcript_27319/m.40333 type:complete len:92 (+) Transcript_27319:505-780(+)